MMLDPGGKNSHLQRPYRVVGQWIRKRDLQYDVISAYGHLFPNFSHIINDVGRK